MQSEYFINMFNFIDLFCVIFPLISNGCGGLDNIALNKTVHMESGYYGYKRKENRAVDGNRSQKIENCTQSNPKNKNSTYVYVDIGYIANIYNVTIYYRENYEQRLHGYTLYYSDKLHMKVRSELDLERWNVCYKDDPISDKPNGIASQVCKGTARYVSVYQNNTWNPKESPILEICEIEIFGCNPGQFIKGGECIPCPETFCEVCGTSLECTNKTYGYQCEKNCSESCVGGCNISTGQCYGCNRGQFIKRGECIPCPGTFCADCGTDGICLACSPDKFGIFCNETCGQCREEPNKDSCDDVTGSCVSGCERGFSGRLCDEECNGTSFGYNCRETCSETCKWTTDGTRLCNSSIGHCYRCMAGKRGVYCKKDCMAMTYGENCSHTCGHCLNGSGCNFVSGACAEGCDAGYQGINCNETCENKTFGSNCGEICGHCRNDTACDPFSGSCDSGCEPGYQGLTCNKTCGLCRHNTDCDQFNGTCSNGCQEGYQGEICNESNVTLSHILFYY
ncbi:multiple epidermal growth factor-like domains protein 10 isoform X3 [Saccostrea cucullata]|uniref:multiple epidermal growth factor-like domains protein 10 isoform X3 n=1 Tax=Saccostrea cuccullata TaxID=36930 RepID=UPI002ED41F42